MPTSSSHNHARASRVARGFTLIELIVVVVLVAVVSGLIAPRVLDVGRRRTDEAARSVRNLLSIAAHRDAIGQQRLAIEHSDDPAALTLMSLRVPAGEADLRWAPDALVAPAPLDGLRVASVSLGGAALQSRGFRIEFPRHEPRQNIEIVLEEDPPPRAGAPRRFVVSLLAGSTQATLDAEAARVPASIDLDGAGRGTSTW